MPRNKCLIIRFSFTVFMGGWFFQFRTTSHLHPTKHGLIYILDISKNPKVISGSISKKWFWILHKSDGNLYIRSSESSSLISSLIDFFLIFKWRVTYLSSYRVQVLRNREMKQNIQEKLKTSILAQLLLQNMYTGNGRLRDFQVSFCHPFIPIILHIWRLKIMIIKEPYKQENHTKKVISTNIHSPT